MQPERLDLNLPLMKRFYLHSLLSFFFFLFTFKIEACCFFYLRRKATNPVEIFPLINLYIVFCYVPNKVNK